MPSAPQIKLDEKDFPRWTVMEVEVRRRPWIMLRFELGLRLASFASKLGGFKLNVDVKPSDECEGLKNKWTRGSGVNEPPKVPRPNITPVATNCVRDEQISIALTKQEWRALIDGVRANRQESGHLQLGRLGWMVVTHLEGKVRHENKDHM